MQEFNHPGWSNNTNIYEVNVRQYTPEGTFAAFQKHLPRLRDMGVEVLWFMPVTPISLEGRKGTLGSYYAVADYKKVNPEFGSLEDFKCLLINAQEMGFKVIVDWVANHTGNDNVWIKSHPEYFEHEANGNIVHPNGWEDVSKLDYNNLEMQQAMIEAMEYWIEECNIDGFRCDMAHLVQLDFWIKAKASISKLKPGLFWLAECEEPSYHEVFDATYTWKWMHASEEYFKKSISLGNLIDVLRHYDTDFHSSAFRAYFTSNHDENSWNGTEYEKYGDAVKLMAVFSCTWNGLPLIYSGQELPNYKRLKFFDKDPIDWGVCTLHDFYKTLLNLRKLIPVLNAGDPSVSSTIIATAYPDQLFIFKRNTSVEEAIIILNFSATQLQFNSPFIGSYADVFKAQKLEFDSGSTFILEPWGYQILKRQ